MNFQKIAIIRHGDPNNQNPVNMILHEIKKFMENEDNILLMCSTSKYAEDSTKILSRELNVEYKAYQQLSNNKVEGSAVALCNEKSNYTEEPVAVIAVVDGYLINSMPVYIMSLANKTYSTVESKGNGEMVFLNLATGDHSFFKGVF